MSVLKFLPHVQGVNHEHRIYCYQCSICSRNEFLRLFSSIFADQVCRLIDLRAMLNKVDRTIESEEVAQLEIASWSTCALAPSLFQVKKDSDVGWIIPSHHNYPADGGTRVGQTAGTFLNVERGRLVTSVPTQHAELEVGDPLAADLRDGSGIGQRVTMKDAGGQVLVDIIVGKADGEGGRYVRVAGDNNVYAARMNPDLRTSFADWVERSLFTESRSDIFEIGIEDYSVDLETGSIKQRSLTKLTKENSLWTSPQLSPEEQIASDGIDQLVNEFIGLRLEGVRPYDEAWLQSRGFYFAQTGRGGQELVGNEGRLILSTTNGIRYILFFGEIALGDSDDQQAELTDEQKVTEGENRYMAVFVQYDPTIDQAFQDALKQSQEQPVASEGEGEESAQNPAENPDPQAIRAENEAKAKDMQERFGQFFYVIRDDSFKTLRPSQETIFIPLEDPATETEATSE